MRSDNYRCYNNGVCNCVVFIVLLSFAFVSHVCVCLPAGQHVGKSCHHIPLYATVPSTQKLGMFMGTSAPHVVTSSESTAHVCCQGDLYEIGLSVNTLAD